MKISINQVSVTAYYSIVALILAMGVGWIMNIVKLIGMFGDISVTAMLIIRIVGVFAAPVGGIVGWF